MGEIRTLRATWRGLETWLGRDTSASAGAPVLDPTCERLGVKFPGPTRLRATVQARRDVLRTGSSFTVRLEIILASRTRNPIV